MALAPTDIKVAGHWKSVDQVSIKIGGHWKPVDQIMEKVAGHWKHVGSTLHPPLFTGAIGDLTAVVGEPFTLDVSHLFSTGPVPASYSLNNPPAGMVISNAGVITWPSPTKVSVSGVSVTATNAGGFAVSDAFGVSAIALGPEKFQSIVDVPAGYAKVTDTEYSFDGTQTGRLGKLSNSADFIVGGHADGKNYLHQFDMEITSGTGRIYIYPLASIPPPGADHIPPVTSHFKVQHVSDSGNYFIMVSTGIVGVIKNISIREVLP